MKYESGFQTRNIHVISRSQKHRKIFFEINPQSLALRIQSTAKGPLSFAIPYGCIAIHRPLSLSHYWFSPQKSNQGVLRFFAGNFGCGKSGKISNPLAFHQKTGSSPSGHGLIPACANIGRFALLFPQAYLFGVLL